MGLTTRRDPESVDMQLLLAVLMWDSARELSPTENSLSDHSFSSSKDGTQCFFNA